MGRKSRAGCEVELTSPAPWRAPSWTWRAWCEDLVRTGDVSGREEAEMRAEMELMRLIEIVDFDDEPYEEVIHAETTVHAGEGRLTESRRA